MWLKDISHCKSISKITNWTKKKISRIVLTLYIKKKKTSCGYIRRRCVNAEREWMKNCSAPLNHRLHFPAMQRKQNGNAALIVEGLHRRTHSIQSFRRHCQVQLAAGKSTCLSSEFPRADLSSISRSGCFCQTSLHSCHVIGAIHIVQWQQLFSCLPWVTLSKVQKKNNLDLLSKCILFEDSYSSAILNKHPCFVYACQTCAFSLHTLLKKLIYSHIVISDSSKSHL